MSYKKRQRQIWKRVERRENEKRTERGAILHTCSSNCCRSIVAFVASRSVAESYYCRLLPSFGVTASVSICISLPFFQKSRLTVLETLYLTHSLSFVIVSSFLRTINSNDDRWWSHQLRYDFLFLLLRTRKRKRERRWRWRWRWRRKSKERTMRIPRDLLYLLFSLLFILLLHRSFFIWKLLCFALLVARKIRTKKKKKSVSPKFYWLKRSARYEFQCIFPSSGRKVDH